MWGSDCDSFTARRDRSVTADDSKPEQAPQPQPTEARPIDPDATCFQEAPQASEAASLVANWPTIPGFTVLGELGRGGMGVVYKAHQTVLNRTVALKTVIGEEQPDPR